MSNSISDWQKKVHELAHEKGWWDGISPRDVSLIPEKIALIHSEASEALECYREMKVPEELGVGLSDPIYDSGRGDVSRYRFSADFTPRKPVGLDSELADIVIRVMDLCEHLGIDLERAIREKHEFNETRPRRHGGKKC